MVLARPPTALFEAGLGEQTGAIKRRSGLLSVFGQRLVGTERIADPEAEWAIGSAEARLDVVRTLPSI